MKGPWTVQVEWAVLSPKKIFLPIKNTMREKALLALRYEGFSSMPYLLEMPLSSIPVIFKECNFDLAEARIEPGASR